VDLPDPAQLLWVSPKEAALLNAKDPVSAPPSPYPVQPGQPGRLVFLSGPPGAGKSSIAGWMAANAGYVYYDGDAFLSGVNPYTPARAEEPSLATQSQPPLVGKGMHARRQLVQQFTKQFDSLLGDYSKVDPDAITGLFTALCEDITRERGRLGGDWVIAFAVPDLASRDLIRRLLGPGAVFVVLQLSPELQARTCTGQKKGRFLPVVYSEVDSGEAKKLQILAHQYYAVT
jgi:hypothetical protein